MIDASRGGYLAAVQARAAAAPDSVAFELVRDGGGFVLTYAGLIERVERLGHALHAAGFGDGARVAICMENRPSWPVSYLSIWYAGAVTVPLDPQLEIGALRRLLGHSEAAACVTSAAQRDKVMAACDGLDDSPVVLQVDVDPREFWEGVSIGSSEPQPTTAEPLPAGVVSLDALVEASGCAGDGWSPRRAAGKLGSIMYTSGTTGDPKGVMIRRGAVVDNLRAALEEIHFSSSDRLLGVLPLFHVLPLVANCLGPLYLGASVVFLSELTAEGIVAAFRRHEITVFVCVPAFFYRFHDRLRERLAALGPARRALAKCMLGISRFSRRWLGVNLGRRLLKAAHRPFGNQMRLLVTGGAKMNAEVFEDFLDWGFTLAQGYGLTEATAVLTVTPLDQLRGDTVGVPIDGVELQIHEPDERGIGEIWARGPNLMEGYYKNPEATHEALVDGWLRTGDLGRLDPSGHLLVTGRAKDVIVLASGKNIYPDELEGHYGQCELIEELCVLGIPDPEGRGERLHAVVVPDLEVARRRGYVNIREMIKWELETLGAKLPGSQRLTSLEVRNEPLPRTTTRKIKRFVLQDEIEKRKSAGQSAAPGVEAQSSPERGGLDARTGVAVAAPATARALAATVPTEARAARPEPVWAVGAMQTIARFTRVDSVSRQDHLDLDLGLESLDRVELFAELQDQLAVDLGDSTSGELHTVGELLDALEARSGQAQPAAGRPSDGDRWARVLGEHPADILPYIRRRPLTELGLWLAARLARLTYSVIAGYRSSGSDKLPTEYPFLICPNHLSFVDPLVVAFGLPLRVLRRGFYVGFSEYFEGRLGRIAARQLRNVPIDPNRNLERALQAAAEGLRRGLVLEVFPEGGRSVDGELREFRRGAAILARHLGVRIVPVGIWGTFQVWPRGGRIRRHPVGVVFGDPIHPANLTDDELTERLRSEVAKLVERAHGLYAARDGAGQESPEHRSGSTG